MSFFFLLTLLIPNSAVGTESEQQALGRLTTVRTSPRHPSEHPPTMATAQARPIDRILLLFPQTPIELRDRGVLYYRLNRFGESRQDLKDYLELSPTAEDAAIVQRLLNQIEQAE